MVAGLFIRIAAALDARALGRLQAALLACVAWETDLGERAARLDEASRRHEAAVADSLTAFVASALAGAAICYAAMALADERELLATTAVQVVGELALSALVAPHRSTIREETERLLASAA